MNEIEKFVREKLPETFVETHVKIVVQEALELCRSYPEADKEVVEIAAWLHDIGHTIFGKKYYLRKDTSKNEGHHIRGVIIAKEFLDSTNLSEEKKEKILHCIESHRTRNPPEPETIEANIIASADNLAHFVGFEEMSNFLGFDIAYAKIERDIKSDFMLSEANEKAKKLFENIMVKK